LVFLAAYLALPLHRKRADRVIQTDFSDAYNMRAVT
jgi:hypothetical protein